MKHFLNKIVLLSLLLVVGLMVSCACPLKDTPVTQTEDVQKHEEDRRFSFTYSVQVHPTDEALDIFLPVAQSNTQQTILDVAIESNIKGRFGQEVLYGNKYWHANLPQGTSDTLDIRLTYQVARQTNSIEYRETLDMPILSERDKELFLNANSRVPVAGELVDSIRTALAPAEPMSLDKARSIYDYVVGNMEYKKVGTGWGNGDTYWACSEKYGNCTDFHALFISLARVEQIPSRFEIGFPVPLDKDSGTISGYHCWVNFYLPESGWFPIDASEAKKDLSKQDLLFGTQPSDRLQFTIGRDLDLGEGHNSGPLNYFIYPHIEQNGKIYSDYTRSFEYKKS
ncbi:MAG: transglutaminase domain-containing protein [Candidatus Marinimicrobia bacterium]|nr:transglutaminase domain-containing protein [Candidatus Neomarinimicrobiota bacterium]